MTFDEWFDKHYPNNNDPLLRKAKQMLWDSITAEMAIPAPPVYPSFGWLCPRCGRGNAPATQTCLCVPAPPIVWTC